MQTHSNCNKNKNAHDPRSHPSRSCSYSIILNPFKMALFRATTKTKMLFLVRFEFFVSVFLMGNWEWKWGPYRWLPRLAFKLTLNLAFRKQNIYPWISHISLLVKSPFWPNYVFFQMLLPESWAFCPKKFPKLRGLKRCMIIYCPYYIFRDTVISLSWGHLNTVGSVNQFLNMECTFWP